jgi:hypothetical protein
VALTRRKKLAFACVPLLLLLGLGEALARAFRERQAFAPVAGGSYRDQRIDLIRRAYPAAHDDVLGYVPRPGFASAANRWGVMVSIDQDGLRRNGDAPRLPGRGVLAVGDSFTFGDQVADADTWPAVLERRLQRPVWNGGVFGYSFAQTALRAEQLLPRLAADTLVVSLIPDDVKRCEQSKRYSALPWFDVVDGALALRNVPVPDSDRSELDQQWVRRWLGYSALCDTVGWNVAPAWWAGGAREVWVHPRPFGRTIVAKLLARLQAQCRERGVRLLLVLQDVAEPSAEGREDGRAVVAAAAALGIATLDLQAEFDALAARDPGLRQQWFVGHMAPAGNAWVAERIAATLAR